MAKPQVTSTCCLFSSPKFVSKGWWEYILNSDRHTISSQKSSQTISVFHSRNKITTFNAATVWLSPNAGIPTFFSKPNNYSTPNPYTAINLHYSPIKPYEEEAHSRHVPESQQNSWRRLLNKMTSRPSKDCCCSGNMDSRCRVISHVSL